MRKLWTAALAFVSALAFFIVGSPSANAFGSEVLGCSVSFGWTAGSCTSYAGLSAGQTLYVNFEPHNLSGAYTTSWDITGPGGAVTGSCSTGSYGTCIYSGCTAGSLSCRLRTQVAGDPYAITAALRLTQSGKTRTVSAVANIKGGLHDGGDPCPLC
ncbi:MAG: hypothetical protein ABIQ09_08060 [Jatrophihabitantaceae bacterium]